MGQPALAQLNLILQTLSGGSSFTGSLTFSALILGQRSQQCREQLQDLPEEEGCFPPPSTLSHLPEY